MRVPEVIVKIEIDVKDDGSLYIRDVTDGDTGEFAQQFPLSLGDAIALTLPGEDEGDAPVSVYFGTAVGNVVVNGITLIPDVESSKEEE